MNHRNFKYGRHADVNTNEWNNNFTIWLTSFGNWRNYLEIRQWSTKNWHFEVWFNNTLKSITIRCKKLATIVSVWKYVARSFIRWKQVSTGAVAIIFRHSCLPVLTWWRLVLRIFDPKQLLRVSCILWCYFSKCY